MTDDTTYGQWANTCGHCGLWHGRVCPRIKAIEYHSNGAIKRVEYHSDWPVGVVQGDPQ